MMKRNSGIQFLRLVACVAVIFQHVNYYSGVSKNLTDNWLLNIDYGSMGVALFFVISGYVMMISMKQGNMFMLNRMVRIYPGCWLAIALNTLLVPFLFVSPIVPAPDSFYLIPPISNLSYTSVPLWTLVYEIAFYFVIYILILCRGNSETAAKMAVAWILIIIIGAKYAPTYTVFPPLTKILFSPMNIWFCEGILLFHLRHYIEKMPKLGLLFCALISWTIADSVPGTSLLYWCVKGMTFFFLIAATLEMSVPKWVENLADATYGAYLTHIIILLTLLWGIKEFGISLSFSSTIGIVFIITTIGAFSLGFLEYYAYWQIKKGTDLIISSLSILKNIKTKKIITNS